MADGSAVDLVKFITAAVTPAVMITACASLIVGINAKQSSLSERIRSRAAESRTADLLPARRDQIAEELVVLYRRFVLTWAALWSMYGSVCAFVVTTLVIVFTGRGMQHGGTLALAAFVVGICLMLVSSLLEITECMQSLRSLRIATRDVLRHDR